MSITLVVNECCLIKLPRFWKFIYSVHPVIRIFKLLVLWRSSFVIAAWTWYVYWINYELVEEPGQLLACASAAAGRLLNHFASDRETARAPIVFLNGLAIANVFASLIRLLHHWMITIVKHRFVLQGGRWSSIVDMQLWQWNSVKTKDCWWKCELWAIICRMSRHRPWGWRRHWR